jgi:hypothetical protein
MNSSRRQFLRTAPLAGAAFLCGAYGEGDACDCVLLNINPALPESFRGFAAVLGSTAQVDAVVARRSGAPFHRDGHSWLMRIERVWSTWLPTNLVIVPSPSELPPDAAGALADFVQAGGNLVLELALGFADPPAVREQQRTLRRYFEIVAGHPVDLWGDARAGRGLPYVDYTWPVPAKVRDFSRAVPLAAPNADIIGAISGLPVAIRVRHGRGCLIVVGSPIGPVLLAGDAGAQRWLHSVGAAFGRDTHRA